MKKWKSHKTFGGSTEFWEHESRETGSKMRFSAFVPQKEIDSCIIWLSGLTCTEENFITKAGVQALLAGSKTMVLCPDTSPRGLQIPGEDDASDFGTGAGFYVDATTALYRRNYRMGSYVAKELPEIAAQFGARRLSLMGHSMGGHGALVLGLKHPETFAALSAFSPIVHPTIVGWGQKAFTGYLGEDQATWKEWDATELVLAGKRHPHRILIDQGREDDFLKKQLQPELFLDACHKKDQACELRFHEGYDHSYYFISTFLKDHIRFHLDALKV